MFIYNTLKYLKKIQYLHKLEAKFKEYDTTFLEHKSIKKWYHAI